ncbi:MAG: hypothetical protein U1G05_05145 [Kiritimatiellia bacterium]
MAVVAQGVLQSRRSTLHWVARIFRDRRSFGATLLIVVAGGTTQPWRQGRPRSPTCPDLAGRQPTWLAVIAFGGGFLILTQFPSSG